MYKVESKQKLEHFGTPCELDESYIEEEYKGEVLVLLYTEILNGNLDVLDKNTELDVNIEGEEWTIKPITYLDKKEIKSVQHLLSLLETI